MVELNTKEYSIIFRWFYIDLVKNKPLDTPWVVKRVFGKLTFLQETKKAEEKEMNSEKQKV